MEKNKGPGLMGKLRIRMGSKRGGKVQVQDVEEGVQVTEEIPEIIDSGKEKHNEEDELQTNADKGPGLMESKREEKVQVQDVEEIPVIVDRGKDDKKSGKEKNNEEELQTLRSEADEPQTKADEERERKDSPEEEKRSLMEKKRKLKKEKAELRAEIGSIEKEMKSLKELMNKVRKRKNSLEEEKESLMEKMRKLEQKKAELQVEIGSFEKEMKSLKKLMDKVRKKKNSPKEENESLMEKMRKLEQKKDELWAQIGSFKKEMKSLKQLMDPVQEVKEMSEIVDNGKEKHNEEELQTLRSLVDELQVELNWRRTHKYADDITLNPDTAHPNLSISEDKKKITHATQPKTVLPTPERFDSTVSVLGSEGFSFGKHYWEVDVRSSNDWDLGVARKSIVRKGKLFLSPKEGFWALAWSGRDYWAKTDPWTRVEVQKKPKKIGVYLSYQDRQVTFFNVTDMSVLFTFNDCSFSGEVYPFFKNSHKETSMRICSIREDE